MLLENITQEQIQQFRQAFALFDKDGDGSISNKELKTVLRSLGHNPTKEQLDMLITLIDEDRSGSIDFRQFLILISKRLTEKTLNDEIIESFKILDKDEDQCFTRLQLKTILMQIGELTVEQIDDLIDKLDQDGQGVIKIADYITEILRFRVQRGVAVSLCNL